MLRIGRPWKLQRNGVHFINLLPSDFRIFFLSMWFINKCLLCVNTFLSSLPGTAGACCRRLNFSHPVSERGPTFAFALALHPSDHRPLPSSITVDRHSCEYITDDTLFSQYAAQSQPSTRVGDVLSILVDFCDEMRVVKDLMLLRGMLTTDSLSACVKSCTSRLARWVLYIVFSNRSMCLMSINYQKQCGNQIGTRRLDILSRFYLNPILYRCQVLGGRL